ncbi:hypothetical protein AAFP30_24990 [Gordonia sp. CPCC 205515]|uniref:hypothetical protein n=1 Tax=Gordonia sp. CPCC 205515 TaxID=3140791 RepID=UPI003AF360DA
MMIATRTLAVVGRRACAALALTSGALHVAVALSGAWMPMTAVTVGMALMCGLCAWHLWRGPDLRAWCAVAMMSLAMIATHLSVGGCHVPQTAQASDAGSPSALMTAAIGIAVVEALVAVAVIFGRTRNDGPHVNGPSWRSVDALENY